ncbi:PEGA domain-containing protein [bacterium]|nr:PEGA domain-containing protein [bacterium]
MRIKKLYSVFAASVFFLSIVVSVPCEELNNVEVIIDRSGAGYDVYYNLVDSDEKALFEVTVRITENQGQTYIFPKALMGDIGFGISPGERRHFHWDAKADITSPLSAGAVFELVPRRLTGDELGSLTVRGLPSDAEVYLDNKPLGLAPVRELVLPVGNHLLRVKKEEYEDFVENIVIEKKTVKDQIYSLVPTFGYITITGMPDGAEVLLNGEKIGETPIDRKRQKRGYYDVTIKKIGYVDYSTNIEVVTGQTSGVQFELEIIKTGQVTFKGDPDGAEVFVDGQRIGETPIIDREMGSGSYTMTVRKKGYKTYVAPFKVERAQKNESSYKLEIKLKKEAFNKSLILPGSGQRYLEDSTKGNVMTVLQFAAIGGAVLSYLNASKAVNDYNDAKKIYESTKPPQTNIDVERENMKTKHDTAKSASSMVYGTYVAVIGVYLWNVIDIALVKQMNNTNPHVQSFDIKPYSDHEISGISVSMRF